MQPGDRWAGEACHFEGLVTVVESVQREVDALPGGLRDSGLAAAALVLAGELDKDRNSATSKAMCAKSLVDVLQRLRELAPEDRKDNPLDEIRARRDRKLARTAGAKG